MRMCWGCKQDIALTGEQIAPGFVHVTGVEGHPDGMYPFHYECSTRAALGGIGHFKDHAFWCLQMHDPDAGLSYRESALQVVEWVNEHGLDAAVQIGMDDGFGAEHNN